MKDSKEHNQVALQTVIQAFSDAKSHRSGLDSDWIDYENQYLSIPQKRKTVKSNIFVPETATAVDVSTTIMGSPFLYNKKFVSVIPQEPADELHATAVEKLLQYQIRASKTARKIRDHIRQTNIMGTSYIKVFWEYKTQRIKGKRKSSRIVGELGNLREEEFYEEVENEIVIYDGPQTKVLSIKNLFIDPDALEIEDSRYVIERTENVSPAFLIEMEEQGAYSGVDRIPAVKEYQEAENKTTTYEYTKDSPNQSILDSGIENNKGIELLEYWENDRHIVVADQQFVLLDEPNPFWFKRKPYVRCRYWKIPFKFYGMGVPEAIKPLQDELNTKRNQILDNINEILNNMWLVARGAIDKVKEQLISRPGGVIICNDINGITPLTKPNISGDTWQSTNDLKVDIEKKTGITPTLLGMDATKHRKTSTEVQIQKNQSQSRLDFTAAEFYEDLADLFELMYLLDVQYMDKNKIFRIIGEEGNAFMSVGPDSFFNDEGVIRFYDFEVTIDPEDSADSQKRQDMIQMVTQFPQMMDMPDYNPVKILDEIMKLFKINPENIKRSEQERAQMMEQQQPPQPSNGYPANGQQIPPQMMGGMQ